MAYRDDEEARKAHVTVLEARIAELESQNAQLLAGDRPVEYLFGSPLTLTAQHEQRGSITTKAMRELFEAADSITGEVGKQSFGVDVGVWRSQGRDLDIRVKREAGQTELRVSERIGLITGAMVGGVLGGGGGVGALVFLFWLAGGHHQPVALVLLPIWAVIMYATARFMLWFHVRSKKRQLESIALTLSARIPRLAQHAATNEDAGEG